MQVKFIHPSAVTRRLPMRIAKKVSAWSYLTGHHRGRKADRHRRRIRCIRGLRSLRNKPKWQPEEMRGIV